MYKQSLTSNFISTELYIYKPSEKKRKLLTFVQSFTVFAGVKAAVFLEEKISKKSGCGLYGETEKKKKKKKKVKTSTNLYIWD